jgi:glycosyltransferase involved in cell wall biosynthesis
MDIFLSYGLQDAGVAARLSRVLEERRVGVWLDSLKLSRGEQAQAELEKLLAKADALVFLVGSESKNDPKLESEWRSALRVEWDTNGTKPMLPVLIGDAVLPHFLGDRLAVRLEVSIPNYDQVADRIIYAIENPFATVNMEQRAAARVEQQERLGEMKRFAETLEPNARPRTV